MVESSVAVLQTRRPGAELVRSGRHGELAYPRDRMGVGVLSGLSARNHRIQPSAIPGNNPRNPIQFLEILETLGAELRSFCKGAHSCSCGEVTVETYCAVRPPSITNSDPVTNEASSEAR